MTGATARAGVFAIAATSLAAVLATGCVTPQIPLPPPDPSILELGLVDRDQGTVQLKGKPNDRTRGALVFVQNVRTQDGVFFAAADDGSFVADPLAVVSGDQVTFWYERGADVSDSTCVVVDYDAGIIPSCLAHPRPQTSHGI